MATSRPLPPGRRGRGARAAAPAAAMRHLPEPRLLSAPSAPAFPAPGAPKPGEKAQHPHQASPWTTAHGHGWGQSASPPAAAAATTVVRDAPRPPPAVTAEAAASKATGFLAARAMFEAKKPDAPAPRPPAPHAPPSRFSSRANSSVTSSRASVQAVSVPMPTVPAITIPEPPVQQPPSSVKALISRLNSPASAAKGSTPATQSPKPRSRFSSSHVDQSVGVVEPPPAPGVTPRIPARHASPDLTAATTTIPTPPAVLAPTAPILSATAAHLIEAPALAPEPAAVPAPEPAAVPAPEPTPVPASVTVSAPRPAVATPSPVAAPAAAPAAGSLAFHPFDLLLPVTAVPVVPRALECVYDDAAAEMQRNVMKAVKKLLRRAKPRVEEFKMSARLFGNGFMDAEDFLAALVRDLGALRALQLVPCLVSIQPDAVKRENLLFAARGYRLRNLDALERQCDPVPSAPAASLRPRLASSDSATSTASAASSASLAVTQAAPAVGNGVDGSSTMASAPKTSMKTERGDDNKLEAGGLVPSEPFVPEPVSEPEVVAAESPERQAKALGPVDGTGVGVSEDPSGEANGESPVSAPPGTGVGAGGRGEPKTLSEADTDSESSAASTGGVSLPVVALPPPPPQPPTPTPTPTPTLMPTPTPPVRAAANEGGAADEAASTAGSPRSVAAHGGGLARGKSPTRADEDEAEAASALGIDHNMFGEAVPANGSRPPRQQAEEPPRAGATAAENLFGGAGTGSAAGGIPAASNSSVEDALSLFGSSSARTSPVAKPRKSVTWGGTQATEIPARRSPPAAPMLFGLATAGAYSDSDSDSDSDFE